MESERASERVIRKLAYYMRRSNTEHPESC